jgi:hypothetical protein
MTMAQATPIQLELQAIEAELRRLESEYHMYFSNQLPRPPWETRKRVESMIRRLDRQHLPATADRFRLSTIQSRFATFVELWDRSLRAREEGRQGPLTRAEPEGGTRAPARRRVVHVATVSDPAGEPEKVEALYRSLMEARRERGLEPVPYEHFLHLVRSQVDNLRARGSTGAAFRVLIKDGKVSFTVRGVTEAGD